MVQQECDKPGCGFHTVEDIEENVMHWEANLCMGYHLAMVHLDAATGTKVVEGSCCNYDCSHHLKPQYVMDTVKATVGEKFLENCRRQYEVLTASCTPTAMERVSEEKDG
jgi:hypothetical protein